MNRTLAVALAVFSCAPAWAQDELDKRSYPDGLAAIVEGEPITRHELEMACQLRRDYRQILSSNRRREIAAAELQELIQQRLLLRKAEDQEIEFTTADQARLDWELGRAALDRRGLDGLKQDLAQIGVSFEYFVAKRKASILIGKLIGRTISRDIFITPREIRDYYAKHPEEFERKGEIRLRQIVLYTDPEEGYRPAPPGLTEELEAWDAERAAKALRKRLLAGESIEELAKQTSMGVNFASDEVYDSDTPLDDVLVPPLGDVVKKLELGQVSDVIRSERDSLHLVVVTGLQEPGVLPIEEVQKEIEGSLKSKIWKDRLDSWIAELRSKAHVKIFPNQPQDQ